MEHDYRSASKRFWQTIRRLRRGKQFFANTMYGAGGELLTSTGDIVGRWKEYFEVLLNPPVTSSVSEAEAEDVGADTSISLAEVTKVVGSLHGGKAPGVDEIRPDYLKSLDVVGLSWADTSLQHRVAIGGSANGVADRGGGPSLQEGGPEGVFQLPWDHTPQPPR
uniref:Reverse transcriptase n=1 Tax=Knipowitschia caucasica TaxID=637954 RepID=A0AAV2LPX6_KNICA